eukprot:TRINITY_DN2818_c1_g2_i2.p1 TRINITY_DN2818_c1_g2~~TRINITY_DN2818_c1_g2_i2.p1  ORF type:complete len:399 (+),score=69.67 TRINITY_DN2818_c1_g2_i2:107-1303(+)
MDSGRLFDGWRSSSHSETAERSAYAHVNTTRKANRCWYATQHQHSSAVPPPDTPHIHVHMHYTELVSPEDIDVDFDSIGGLEAVKESLHDSLFLPFQLEGALADRASSLVTPSRGVLFYGPPGTGKTMLAKAIARQAQFTFINIKPSSVLSCYVGESEKLVRAVFSLAAKLEPSIVFIDEIDSMFVQRSVMSGGVQVEAEFLSAWDGLLTDSKQRIVVIGATNKPQTIPEPILRRLPTQHLIPLPGAPERVEILQIVLGNEELAGDVDLYKIAALTEGYSGSDLKEVCKKAAIRPTKELVSQIRKRRPTATTATTATATTTTATIATTTATTTETPTISTTATTEEGEPLRPRPLGQADLLAALSQIRPTGESARAYGRHTLETQQRYYAAPQCEVLD